LLYFDCIEKGHLRTKEKLGAFLRNFDGLEGIESQLKGKKKKEEEERRKKKEERRKKKKEIKALSVFCIYVTVASLIVSCIRLTIILLLSFSFSYSCFSIRKISLFIFSRFVS
jgi:hypothetical protein